MEGFAPRETQGNYRGPPVPVRCESGFGGAYPAVSVGDRWFSSLAHYHEWLDTPARRPRRPRPPDPPTHRGIDPRDEREAEARYRSLYAEDATVRRLMADWRSRQTTED